MAKPREQWGSRAGFIMAAAGSAVGLGNIWKYPHMAGQHGGGAFTVVYLICILFVGLPILMAEISIGRRTQLNPVGAFKALSNNSSWKFVGLLGVASAFTILSFYSVVGGWTLKYTMLALTGAFNDFAVDDSAAQAFNAFVTNPISPVLWHLVFMGLCVLIINQGVKAGIERWSKILMPVLLGILLLLVVRGVTLEGAGEGLRFLFWPKWGDLDASAVVLALGHSFFTISLGMGTMITYGSYLSRDSDILQSALWIIFIDTAIALLAGVAIFTAVFALGQNPAEGPGLIFVVLPSLFPHMPGGAIFAVMFFGLLFVAALTSAISILEVVTAYFIDEKGWSRSKATYTFGGVIAFIGVLASLSNGSFNLLAPFTELTFMDLLDKVSSKYMLPLGGMLTAFFVLLRWGIVRFTEEIKAGARWFEVNRWTVTTIFTIAGTVVAYIFVRELIALFG